MTDDLPSATGPEDADYRLLVAYDGGPFHGWQFQPELPTVQGELERALEAITGRRVRIQGAGRTDAGVHALGQVASFRVATRIPAGRLAPALNAHLPGTIRVLASAAAPDRFSARFSAHWRAYRYVVARRETPFTRGRATVPRGPWPALAPMQEALPPILGEHDFRACTTQPDGPFGSLVHEASWSAWEEGYVFSIRANRFLYQMVRILVGTCLEIGAGRRTPESLGAVLAGGDRRAAGVLAPPSGLYLAAVGYDPPWPEDEGERSSGVVVPPPERWVPPMPPEPPEVPSRPLPPVPPEPPEPPGCQRR